MREVEQDRWTLHDGEIYQNDLPGWDRLFPSRWTRSWRAWAGHCSVASASRHARVKFEERTPQEASWAEHLNLYAPTFAKQLKHCCPTFPPLCFPSVVAVSNFLRASKWHGLELRAFFYWLRKWGAAWFDFIDYFESHVSIAERSESLHNGRKTDVAESASHYVRRNVSGSQRVNQTVPKGQRHFVHNFFCGFPMVI